MKKPSNFTERSETVFCANPKCSQVRGAEGVSRMAIKENVVVRQTTNKPILCYDCAIHAKTGKTRKQRKEAATQRRVARAQAAQEAELRAMAAKA